MTGEFNFTLLDEDGRAVTSLDERLAVTLRHSDGTISPLEFDTSCGNVTIPPFTIKPNDRIVTVFVGGHRVTDINVIDS